MIPKSDFDSKNLWKLFCADRMIISLTIIVFIFSCIVGLHLSLILGLIISFSFASGCAIIIVALQHKHSLKSTFEIIYRYAGIKAHEATKTVDCNVCGIAECKRRQHFCAPTSEPWRNLFISKDLDEALSAFYVKILNAFVASWFSLLSKNDDFVNALKFILREATCRLILKLKELDMPKLLTDRLLPCTFSHHEIVQKLIANGITLDKLADNFYANDYQIHPAVRNRHSELDYLRAVAKCLLPRVCNNQNLDSKVFFSLVRELLACWVLLPLMDVLSNPNWLNAMIIATTDPNPSSKTVKGCSNNEKVMFLASLINEPLIPRKRNESTDTKFLTDQHQLYLFMQFLKREGAVDVLRFYLDVDNLNAELSDPKLTSDPAKLSMLQQQSENLLNTYKTIMEKDSTIPIDTLAEAQEDVKNCLEKKWQKAFHLTPEYFQMIYGNRESQDPVVTNKNSETQSGTVSRFGSKLKGAIRGAIDGAPLDAMEVPTVWDAFTDEQPSNNSTGNSTIYSSVTQKLRKERGQNLDAFISTFMQSVEQSTDVGEDVIG